LLRSQKIDIGQYGLMGRSSRIIISHSASWASSRVELSVEHALAEIVMALMAAMLFAQAERVDTTHRHEDRRNLQPREFA